MIPKFEKKNIYKAGRLSCVCGFLTPWLHFFLRPSRWLWEAQVRPVAAALKGQIEPWYNSWGSLQCGTFYIGTLTYHVLTRVYEEYIYIYWYLYIYILLDWYLNQLIPGGTLCTRWRPSSLARWVDASMLTWVYDEITVVKWVTNPTQRRSTNL